MPDSLPLMTPDAPINQEPPLAALDTPLTHTDIFFTRNNGTLPPSHPDWTLAVTGLVARPQRLTPAALRARFATVELTSVLECAGNGRSAITPPSRRICARYP